MTDSNKTTLLTFDNNGSILIARLSCTEIISLEHSNRILGEIKSHIDFTNPPHLLIDFSQVSFIATCAINMLLVVLKRVRLQGGDVYLCGLSHETRQLFDLMQLSKLFEIWPTCEVALQTIQTQTN
jgi:anti-anti-sigma factor